MVSLTAGTGRSGSFFDGALFDAQGAHAPGVEPIAASGDGASALLILDNWDGQPPPAMPAHRCVDVILTASDLEAWAFADVMGVWPSDAEGGAVAALELAWDGQANVAGAHVRSCRRAAFGELQRSAGEFGRYEAVHYLDCGASAADRGRRLVRDIALKSGAPVVEMRRVAGASSPFDAGRDREGQDPVLAVWSVRFPVEPLRDVISSGLAGPGPILLWTPDAGGDAAAVRRLCDDIRGDAPDRSVTVLQDAGARRDLGSAPFGAVLTPAVSQWGLRSFRMPRDLIRAADAHGAPRIMVRP